MRPSLTKGISLEAFRSFYWLKEELQTFCRENNINAVGSKVEITERLEHFLRTGEVKAPIRKVRSTQKKEQAAVLSLSTVITDQHRCSQNVRAFFKSVIPTFHFSTFIQDYFKNNVGKTYEDVVNAWFEEQDRKKSPSYRKDIAPQFEYNKFIRDFFADVNNKGKSREQAIQAWNHIKKLPGSNKYNQVIGENTSS